MRVPSGKLRLAKAALFQQGARGLAESAGYKTNTMRKIKTVFRITVFAAFAQATNGDLQVAGKQKMSRRNSALSGTAKHRLERFAAADSSQTAISRCRRLLAIAIRRSRLFANSPL